MSSIKNTISFYSKFSTNIRYKMNRKFLLLFLSVTFVICDKATIDYYERLINDEIQRSAAYKFPKDASAYRPFSNQPPTAFGTYDFVVIGAGSAGAVVASRLSEIPNWNVLLLEAGGEETNFTDIPSMSIYTANLEHNWGFNSTPQSTCCLAMGGRCPFPRGRSLGGTSAINALVYSRGNKLDYDKWCQQGNPGWSYEDVLPFFIKSENCQIVGDDGYHGYNGYLNVERHSPITKKMDVFLNANKRLGRNVNDFNGKQQLGASYTQFNMINGRRQSSAKAFLASARSRTSLRILTNSYVTKILICNVTKAAYGVLFSHENVQYVAKIKKEIILSAGVVGSPSILMHSGVGPKHHLKQLNITLIKDLKVGYNYHDHLTFHNTYFTTSMPNPTYPLRSSIMQYLNGTGPLTIATNPEGLAFLQLSAKNTTAPDIEVVFIPSIAYAGFDGVENGIVHGTVDRVFRRIWKRSLKENFDVSQIVFVLLHPKTRGRIYLNSSDPYIYPLIDSKCLCDDNNEDVANVYRGILKIMELLETDEFKQINTTLMVDPRCAHYIFKSRAYWMCLIRQTAMNAYHGGGTCQMGPDPDKGAVVDSKLKVHGMRNLRIADTSIVPVTLSAHMSAPAMMIGERVADFIKTEYGVS